MDAAIARAPRNNLAYYAAYSICCGIGARDSALAVLDGGSRATRPTTGRASSPAGRAEALDARPSRPRRHPPPRPA